MPNLITTLVTKLAVMAALWIGFMPSLSQAQAPNTFANTGQLGTARFIHTSTLLPNGKVLVTGGADNGGTSLDSAELYDPATGTWTPTGSLATPRRNHTATLLPNGKVLVAGGFNNGSWLASAELYDPTAAGGAGAWSPAGSLATPRVNHTATLLHNGKLLVAGGYNNISGFLDSAELYDPAADDGTGDWSPVGTLATPREHHTATLLPNGKLLVAGGYNDGSSSLASAELYDPAANNGVGAWTATGPLAIGRYQHTATLLPNGKVLVAGGYNGDFPSSAELYDPAAADGTGAWTATGPLAIGRNYHTATLLPNGKLLIAGGEAASATRPTTAELYDPTAGGGTGAWTLTGLLVTGRNYHTATLLPNGKLLIAGGYSGGATSSAELYDSATGAWNATGSLGIGRSYHTASLLPNGKVLVAGGPNNVTSALASAEHYNPTTSTWSAANSLSTGRFGHTATLMPYGQVLLVGGTINGTSYLASTEHDPVTSGGSLGSARGFHTATLLPNGKLLVAGGYNGSSYFASAELNDPTMSTWTATGSLAIGRGFHTATLLANGKVLVAGGYNGSSSLDSAQLYDPSEGKWVDTAPFATGRRYHTATLLPNGKVLVAGGYDGSVFLASSELYDPAANNGLGAWAATGPLATGCGWHTATLLPNGKVLVAGGLGNGGNLASVQLYDPAIGTWTAAAPLTTARAYHTATLLPNGKLLVAGGSNSNGIGLASAQLYDVGLGFSGASRPVIGSVSFNASGGLVLTGTGFLGISSASGGNGSQDSPTNYPVVQLRRLDNEQCVYLAYDPSVSVSATSLMSLPVPAFPGYALVTVFTNGIPSDSALVSLPPQDIALEAPTGTPVDNGAGTLAFAIAPGQIKDFGVTVRNAGRKDLTAISAYISGPDVWQFALVSTPPATLAAGESATFSVRFSSNTPGVKSATLFIDSNDPDEDPFTLTLSGTVLSYTTDSDGDGMSDAAEHLMFTLGFDWQVNQAELVSTYYTNANAANLHNQAQYDANRMAGHDDVTSAPNTYSLYSQTQYDANFTIGRTTGQNDVTSVPNTYGLYTLTQVQAINVGVPLLAKDPGTGKFKLTMGVQKSNNLTAPFIDFPMNTVGTNSTINAAGKLEFEFTSPDNAAFFRVESK